MRDLFSFFGKSLVCGALLLCITGCENSPQRVPVTGTVLIDGVPVPSGFVRVIPDTGRASFGEIDSAGRFTLTSLKPGDGCLPGEHPVEVVSVEPINESSQRRLIPALYADPSVSQLKVKITDQPTDLKIELTWFRSGQKAPYIEKFNN